MTWRTVQLLAAVILFGTLGSVAAQFQPMEPLRYQVGVRGTFITQGLLISEVQKGSEADKAGLIKGDIITKIDNQNVTSQADFVRMVNQSGGTVGLTVRKAFGEFVRVKLELGAGLPEPGQRLAPFFLGVAGDFSEDGLKIKTVLAGTPAAAAGLKEGDIIERVERRAIRSSRDLTFALAGSNGTVTMEVKRGKTGRMQRITADLRVYELGAIGDFGQQGLLVKNVAPGTAADRIGLQPGDTIVQIDDQVIRSQDDYTKAIKVSGGSVVLTVRKLRGPLVRLPADLVNNPLGAFGEEVDEGVRILSVAQGGPADAAGLMRGDVIVKVDNERVRTKKELTKALNESGGFATLIIRRASTGQLAKAEVLLSR